MNIKRPFVKLSALAALVAALPLMMAPSGGYPTRPIFQSVRVGSNLSDPGTNNTHVHGTETADGGFVGNLTGTVTGHASLDCELTGCTMTGPIVGSLTGGASLDLPLTGGVLTGALTAPTVSASATAASDVVSVANASGFAACGAEVNGTSSAGLLGMPAGDAGFACLSGTLFLHAGNGNIATDATVVPWTAAPTTGTATLTYVQGCTSGSFAPSLKYVKAGSIVTVTFTSTADCAGVTNVAISMSGWPSAIQPASGSVFSALPFTNSTATNSDAVTCSVDGSAFTCLTGAFNGVAVYLNAGSTFTYSIN